MTDASERAYLRWRWRLLTLAQIIMYAGPIIAWSSFFFGWKWVNAHLPWLAAASFVALLHYQWLFLCPRCGRSFNYSYRRDLRRINNLRCLHCGLYRGDTTFRDRLSQ